MRLTISFLVLAFFVSAVVAMADNDYTETPELWSAGAMDYIYLATMESVTQDCAVGKYSLALNHSTYSGHYLTFPNFRNADWDLSDTEYLEFQIKPQAGYKPGWTSPTLYLWNRDGSCIRIRPARGGAQVITEVPGKWQTVRIPIKEAAGWDYVYFLNPSIEHIDYFEIHLDGGNLPEGAAHSVLFDDVKFGPNPIPYTPPNENAGDLDVLNIERNPKYERYDVGERTPPAGWTRGVPYSFCRNAESKHQPDDGEEVTFTAYVQNKGKRSLGGKYVWIMDGKEVSGGDLQTLRPREKASFDWKWNWDPADHDLTFKIIPNGEDYCDYNNDLTIRTNALMYRFMVERGALTRMETKRNMYGSYSCEDWLQGQLYYMNRLFEFSKYGFAPNGITQRVMAGKIEYVEDGDVVALGAGPFRVGETDLSLDGGRGLTAYDNPWGRGSGGIHEYLNYIGSPNDAWLHELSHQIGVIDDYQTIVEPENNAVNGVAHNYRNAGIMGGGDCSPLPNLQRLFNPYSPSNVQGLNATKGKRRGYYGEYLFQIPKECSLSIIDERGNPISNAEIKVYQTKDRKISNTVVHEGKTNASGIFALQNRKTPTLVTESGCVISDNPFGPIHVVGFNGVFLVTVKKDGKDLYGFTDVTAFNVAYAAGNTETAVIPVTVKIKGDETVYYGTPLGL